MTLRVSPVFQVLGVLAAFATIATGATMLFALVSPGPARLRVEHRVMPECGGPGYLVVGGRDWDRDGALGDQEAETLSLVCSVDGRLEESCDQEELDGAFDAVGKPRHRLQVLLGFEAKASDAACASGSLRAEVGVDKNRDGTLGADEITEARPLCQPAEAPQPTAEAARFARSL
jgi:hypothetical protein